MTINAAVSLSVQAIKAERELCLKDLARAELRKRSIETDMKAIDNEITMYTGFLADYDAGIATLEYTLPAPPEEPKEES